MLRQRLPLGSESTIDQATRTA